MMLNINTRELYSRSFTLFCRDVLHQPMGRIHQEIINNLENDKKSNFSIMVSRGFYKTYIFSRCYPLWLIFRSDKPIHIIIQSMNQDMSRRILGLIRDVLTTNEYFYNYKFKKETDKLLELYIPGHEGDNENTHKIYSVPVGTRGLHGDLLIVDDAQKDDEGNSTNLKKIKTLFWNASSPMVNARNGRILFIGTPIAYDDMFSDLFDLSIKSNSGWKFFKYPAIYEDDDGEFNSNFPEVYPLEKLLQTKENMPSYTWEQEYMLNPVGGEDSIFPIDLINKAIDLKYPEVTEEEQKYKSYYLGCDVAMSSSSKADFSAFCVVSKCPNHPIKLEYIWKGKGVSEDDQINKIKELKRIYNIEKGLIERKGLTYSIRGYHPLWPDFPDGSSYGFMNTGLVPVRSSLLRESR